MPCFDLDRAAGAWELGMGVPRGSNGTSRCLSRTAVFATKPNRQAARDVTRPTRHITLQLEHPLRLSPSTEAHRTEPASRCCTSGVPDSMGTDAERASSTRMRKKLGALGNRRSNQRTAGPVSIGADTRSMLRCRYGVVMDTVSPPELRRRSFWVPALHKGHGPRRECSRQSRAIVQVLSSPLSDFGIDKKSTRRRTGTQAAGPLPRRIVCPAGVPNDGGRSKPCLRLPQVPSLPPCSHCIHRWMSAEQMQ